MKKKDVLNLLACFAVAAIFLTLTFIGFTKPQKTDSHVQNDTGMIRRSATGHFTTGGSALAKKVNQRQSVPGIIYIGEPTEGLLD